MSASVAILRSSLHDVGLPCLWRIRLLPIKAITRTTPSRLTVFSIVTLIAAQRSA
ncbi:hypothetical protein [Methylobacterium longum]|uniref:Uncharacterized protein n=1 Tax=Methylobacterium longum TaxID=767694 RepID=A0ABT8AW00_9HYPH|nr:hypothetical protein [Methylobacterium longum]MDN3573964.1 hypothetical protein [Methylobacterium longum]